MVISLHLLEGLERVDTPERLGEIGRVVLHKVVAASRAATCTKDCRRPVATKSIVHNDLVVGKVGRGAVASKGEVGIGRRPSAGGRSLAGYVGRDTVAWEEPHAKSCIAPPQSINTTSVVVKSDSIRLSAGGTNTASRIVRLLWVSSPTVQVAWGTGLLPGYSLHGAPIRSV